MIGRSQEAFYPKLGSIRASFFLRSAFTKNAWICLERIVLKGAFMHLEKT